MTADTIAAALLLLTTRAERVLHGAANSDPAQDRAELDAAIGRAWSLLRPGPADDQPEAARIAPWRPTLAEQLPQAAFAAALDGAGLLDSYARTPYGQTLIAHAVDGLARAGWLAPDHDSPDYQGPAWTAEALRRALLTMRDRARNVENLVDRINHWVTEQAPREIDADSTGVDIALRLLDRAATERDTLLRGLAPYMAMAGAADGEPSAATAIRLLREISAHAHLTQQEASLYKQEVIDTAATVARMHEAAMGKVTGPVVGVVEDVTAVREKLLAAESQLLGAEHVLVQVSAGVRMLLEEVDRYDWKVWETDPATGRAHLAHRSPAEAAAEAAIEVSPALALCVANIATTWPAVAYDSRENPDRAAEIAAAARQAGIVAIASDTIPPRTLRGCNLLLPPDGSPAREAERRSAEPRAEGGRRG